MITQESDILEMKNKMKDYLINLSERKILMIK